MNVALRRAMTIDEFLAWEERQDIRHEFDGYDIRAMVGGTGAHSDIQASLIIAVGSRLRGKPCKIVGSDLKVIVNGSIRYPDAMIICGPYSARTTIATDPVVVFEIVSPSSARIDRIHKNDEYRATPSIQRYVILEQEEIAAEVFTRAGEDWAGRIQRAGSVLHIPEAGIELPLDELYDRLDFTPAP